MLRRTTPVLLALALAGWSATPSVSLTPSVTSSGVSPSVSSPSPKPSFEFRTPEDEANYKQAEANFRVAMKEFDRLAIKGDTTSPSTKLSEVATESFLRALVAMLKFDAERGIYGVGWTSTTAIAPKNVADVPGAITGVSACVDGSKTYGIDKQGNHRTRGRLTRFTVYYKFVNGKLKGFDGESVEIKSCDI